MQKAYGKMHLLMAANALAAYPDHNKWLDVYTDASDFQLASETVLCPILWGINLLHIYAREGR